MKIKEIIKNENYIPSNPTSNTPSQSTLKNSRPQQSQIRNNQMKSPLVLTGAQQQRALEKASRNKELKLIAQQQQKERISTFTNITPQDIEIAWVKSHMMETQIRA